MFRVFLKPGVRFKIENRIYEILKRLPNSNIQVQDIEFGDIKLFTDSELISFLCKGLLKFEVKGKNIKIIDNEKLNTEFDFGDIENLKHKEEARFKFEVIRPLLEINYARRKSSDIKERVSQINLWISNPNLIKDNLKCTFFKKVSVATVYRWLLEYEKGGEDIRALIPSYYRSGGKNKHRSHQKVIDFINEEISETHLKQQRVTMRETYFAVVNKISEYNEFAENKISFPSFATVARYISKIPEYELVAFRIGKRTAEQRFSPVGSGVIVNHPLERVEIDSTEIDLILLDAEGKEIGRPNLVIAIDKFSRYPLGLDLSFGGVGWPEVMSCIRHIMCDKSYVKDKYPYIENEWKAFGVPKTIVVDNGLGFKNHSIEDACYQLGFVLEFCPPRVPEWKGSIERFFGTTNTSLLHNLPGTTRSNPKQLGDNEDPSKYACISFSVFMGLLHKWIIDIYCQDINKGAGGIPSKIWDRGINEYPVGLPNSISELAILLGRVDYRSIKNTGIELNGLYYNSFDLNKLFIKFSLDNKGKNNKFKVKYDPSNLGEIYIYDHLIENEWIRVPGVCQEYAHNLSEWEHKEARACARKEFGQVDIEALAKAKAVVKKMVDNNIGYRKGQIAKAKKISSSSEIFGQNDYINRKVDILMENPLDVTNTNISNNSTSISNMGSSPFSNNNFLPPVQIIESKKENANVIKIKDAKNNSRSTRKVNTSKGSLLFESTLGVLDDELLPEDFFGFEVIKGTKGKKGE